MGDAGRAQMVAAIFNAMSNADWCVPFPPAPNRDFACTTVRAICEQTGHDRRR
jgi:hypothetical protein